MARGETRGEVIRLEPVIGGLPDGFDVMRGEARSEGYRMLDTLAGEWASGQNHFMHPGEALMAAYSGGVLAGIGGITIEPAIAGAFRMRRFYVRPAFRRGGIARRLALTLLDRLPLAGRVITANAAPGSDVLWEALGFSPVRGESWTHL